VKTREKYDGKTPNTACAPMSNERPLSGTNFVFFGGSTGIGRAAAIEVAKRGACILILG
jgi:hypothetical protein